MATRVCVLDGGDPKDSKNTLNSFLTKCGEKVFWQIATDMVLKEESNEIVGYFLLAAPGMLVDQKKCTTSRVKSIVH